VILLGKEDLQEILLGKEDLQEDLHEKTKKAWQAITCQAFDTR
jgi:hypothetical protein